MPESQIKTGKDLWGASFEDTPEETVVVSLLKEQAEALSRRTQGKIVGEVESEIDHDYENGYDLESMTTSLYARVALPQKYRHKLIALHHPILVDPNNPFPLFATDTQQASNVKITDRDQFIRWIEEILSSPEVHNVIKTLIRYGRERAAS